MKSYPSSDSTQNESLSFRPWNSSELPSRILVIRLHAIGDVAITLPYCAALREQFPATQIDFLTSEACADLPSALTLFDTIHVMPHALNRWQRALHTLRWCSTIQRYKYDVVVDLQRNWVSRAVRRATFSNSWGEFDRTSPKPAGERVQDTFRNIRFPVTAPRYTLPFREDLRDRSSRLLNEHGWNNTSKLIVLNPAGLWTTRNWPLPNYTRLARLWLQNEQVQFILLGTRRIDQKAKFIQDEIGKAVINLTGKTSLSEAFALLQHAAGIISEDSGLMHMAWVSGIPTVALLGSSRHDWSRPLGPHSQCLHSGDLECGACMQPTCKYGDVHCLTRYSPEQVLEAAQQLIPGARKETATA